VVKWLKSSLEDRNSGEMALLAGLCLVAAVALTGISVFSMQRARIFANSAVAAQAEVVEMLKEPREATADDPARFQLIPVFQYKVAGTVFEHRLADRRSEYSVGDTTTIYYNPENPSEIRDVLKPESTRWPTIIGGVALVFWAFSAGLLVLSIRSVRRASREHQMKLDGINGSNGHSMVNLASAVRTACVFVALEATAERSQNSRMIRLVCRWTHPESGREHILRSANFHPTKLPTGLELGMMVPCLVDFDYPELHDVLWREFSTAGLAQFAPKSSSKSSSNDEIEMATCLPTTGSTSVA
jgi:hypothetical protein